MIPPRTAEAVPPTAKISYKGNSTSASDVYTELPALNTIASLIWIGIRESVAIFVYRRWDMRDRSDKGSLLQWIWEYIDRPQRDDCMAHDPDVQLGHMGVSESLHECFVDPSHSRIVEMRPLKFWIKHTLQLNHDTLSMLLEQRKQERVLDEWACRNLPPAHIAVIPQGQIPSFPGHKALYKVMNEWQLDGWIQSDGSVDLYPFVIHNDFHPFHDIQIVGTRWLTDSSTAEQHRDFLAARCTQVAIYLIRIEVPASLYELLLQAHNGLSSPGTAAVVAGYWTFGRLPSTDQVFGSTLEMPFERGLLHGIPSRRQLVDQFLHEIPGKIFIEVTPARGTGEVAQRQPPQDGSEQRMSSAP